MANTVYNNQVIEAKAKDLLATSLNVRNVMAVDNSLTQTAGMEKIINVYTYSGTAEELESGEGNSGVGSISFVPNSYIVKTVQQKFNYTDEDYLKDNTIVDNMLKGANQVMVNKMTADFTAELAKATLTESGAFGYSLIVDGISKLNIEDESQIFVVIPYAWKAALRKDEDYKTARMGEVVYNGQVGTIAGIPVIATKALTDAAYVMTKEAVKLFMKKDVEVEQEREANTRTNNVFLRSFYVVALADATQICKLTKNA